MAHKIVRIVTIIILLLIPIDIFIHFLGTPWDRYSNYRKASQYLKNKYAQEMIIKDVVYSYENGRYYIYAYPEGRKDLVFEVSQIVTPQSDFEDDLFDVIWEKEMNDEISTITKSIYSCSVKVISDFYGYNNYSEYVENCN